MPGYKQWADGDNLLPAEIDEYLMGQTIMRFGNASVRAAALPSPTNGMRSYLASDGVDYMYTADGWVPMSPLVKVKSAETQRSNTAARTSDPHLAGIPVTKGVHKVEAILGIRCGSTTPGFSLSYSFSGTASTVYRQSLGLHSSGTPVQSLWSINALGVGTTYGTPGSTTDVGVRESMLLVVTAAGVLDLQWAQGTSSASAVALDQGSHLIITRLGAI